MAKEQQTSGERDEERVEKEGPRNKQADRQAIRHMDRD